jgi:hypothetical protein
VSRAQLIKRHARNHVRAVPAPASTYGPGELVKSVAVLRKFSVIIWSYVFERQTNDENKVGP